ncbi:branched-chain amino acid transport system permease protein [Thermocatellispora tengchongensis]|uniref:Branched-chain amino acid transport system permease protein n=1 Tax=Thermocatellispora tengchongensis TaxID=1073253 RepID=A0A840PFA8_9ACTN|nr:branched-chain amino acid ABC transporter permease [Thermocatellispora tengchongensis]MBB5137852.1 branched-chain amino acid transport system permease protein [Thermocatellispora tengchongensis]
MSAAVVLNGILLGGLYGMSAMGLSLVFGVLRLVNMAHGAMLVLGAYLAVLITAGTPLPLPVAGACAVLLAGGLGYVLQRHLLTAMLVRGANGPLVATFGLSLIASGLVALRFGSDPVSIPTALGTAGWSLWGLDVRAAYAVSFALAGVVAVALHLTLSRTRLGAAVRAAAADPRTADLIGIDVRTLYALVFAVASALAALAGLLVGVAFSVSPQSGTSYLLIAMAVVVLGGIGNVLGTFAGAILLGVVQTLAAAQFGGGYRDLVVYILFFVVLAVLPRGLFGRRLT